MYTFDFDQFRDDLVVTFEQPSRGERGDTPIFHFGCPDYPQDSFRFTHGEEFRFYRDDYIPSSLFTIPAPCYAGFTAPTSPTIVGTSDVTLDALTAVGIALQLQPVNRSVIRKPNCVPIENAVSDVRVETHADGQNAEVLNKALCGISEKAIVVNPEFCGFSQTAIPVNKSECSLQDETESLKTEMCSPRENAIPTNSDKTCVVVDETLAMRNYICAPRQNAIPTNDDPTCVVIEEAGGRQIHESRILYPASGEPYTPLHIFSHEQYLDDAEPVAKIVPRPIPNYQLTFKPRYDVDDKHTFDLLEYEPATFFMPLLFYPNHQQINCVPLNERRWQWLFGDPILVTIKDTISPLRNGLCNSRGDTLFTDKRTCSLQENAELPPPGMTPFVDPRPEIPTEPPSGGGETIIVPTKEVYKVKNTIITTLADGTPLDINNVSLAFDSDSHSWQWSGDLLEPSQANLVKPAANGTPVIVHVTINTKVWHLLVERTTTTRRFNSNSIGLSGRGITALLAEPYSVATGVEITTVLTNQQIAESFMPTGWTLTWNMPVWNVPANAYSHQNSTPIQALKQFVDSCGGMLVPQTDAQVIKVIKRYPVLPWNFAAAIPDLIIPDDIIVELREEPISAYGANGVFVHGLDNGGKQALCRITGTAGDRLATTAVSNVMVDVDALRALGERTLAGAYVQPKIKSVATIMDGGTTIDLVDVGTFVEFDVDNLQDRGIVNSVSIETSTSEEGVTIVGQSLGVGESTDNTFSLFRELLPPDPLTLVKLLSVSGNTSQVETVDGVIMRVRGTGIANANYYVKAGKIDGVAPNLPILSDIVV